MEDHPLKSCWVLPPDVLVTGLVPSRSTDALKCAQELEKSSGSPNKTPLSSANKRAGVPDSIFMTGHCEEWLVNPSATPPPTPDPGVPIRHALHLSPPTPPLGSQQKPRHQLNTLLDTGASKFLEEAAHRELLGELDAGCLEENSTAGAAGRSRTKPSS